jgi:hypothetical protein
LGCPARASKIENACWEDTAFRVLTGNQQPDPSRISDFRCAPWCSGWALCSGPWLCKKTGLVSLGHVALDGTKVKANASKHKTMSHELMLKSEKQLEAEMRACCARPSSLMPMKTSSSARTNAVMSCRKNSSGAVAGWSKSARPRPNWKLRLLPPRPPSGSRKPPLANRREQRQKPVVTTRPANGHHAVVAGPANGRMTPTSWPMRKPRRPALNPLTSLQLVSAISWRCRCGNCPPMRATTPNPRLRGTSQTLTATSSRELTVGSRGTRPGRCR